jgi:hypothetical protein
MSILSTLDALKEFLFKLPAWLRVAWIAWAIVTFILILLTLLTERTQATDTRLSRIEERLDIISMKLDALLHSPREPFIRIGTLNIPQPALDLRVGWVAAVVTTVGAPSLSAAAPSKVAAIFETITQPEALVNAVLQGAVMIQEITLERNPKRKGDYTAKLRVANNTSARLEMEIPKGQVFENAARYLNIQNLVAVKDMTITCEPHEAKIIDVPAYCLNHLLKQPLRYHGRITPLKICFDFTDQPSLWNSIEDRMA